MKKLLAALTALSLIAVASCADLRDLSALQQDLAREFHHAAVNVNVNNGAYPYGSLPELPVPIIARF